MMELEIEIPNGNPRMATVKIDGKVVTDVTGVKFDINTEEVAEVEIRRYIFPSLKLRGTFEDVTDWKDPNSDPMGDVKRAAKRYGAERLYPDA